MDHSHIIAALLLAGLWTAPGLAAPLRFEAKEAPPGQAVLEIQADELVTMTTLPFRLLLKDPAGRPLTGARKAKGSAARE